MHRDLYPQVCPWGLIFRKDLFGRGGYLGPLWRGRGSPDASQEEASREAWLLHAAPRSRYSENMYVG